jgi:hypothetical protein
MDFLTAIFFRRTAVPVVAVISLTLLASPAGASEGGASFYVLGSGGPGAALLPPLPGIYADNTIYYYHGEAQSRREFVLGGNVVAGLKASMLADFGSLLWVPSTDFAGGTLALGGTFVAGRPDVEASAVLSGPGGGQVAVSVKDAAWVVSDPAAMASLGWNLGGNTYLATTTTVNVPIGTYREGKLANLAFHRWIVDQSLALTWNDPAAGWDVSGKAGVTFNGTNHFTDYHTGTELHFEASLERIFSKTFSAGVQAYHYEQVTGDSGDCAVLGPFEGKVTGVGATAKYGFNVGNVPLSLRARLFKEFGEKNRLGNGTSFMLSVGMPLQVKLPVTAPAR